MKIPGGLYSSRSYGKRDAQAGLIAARLLSGHTVLSYTTDPYGTRQVIEERLRALGDTEPETAMCGLTTLAPDGKASE